MSPKSPLIKISEKKKNLRFIKKDCAGKKLSQVFKFPRGAGALVCLGETQALPPAALAQAGSVSQLPSPPHYCGEFASSLGNLKETRFGV